MFISDEKLKKISSRRVQAGWLFFILVAVVGKIHNPWPILFIISGETIRTLAAGTIRKNETLAKNGIYKIVRHPLYLGSFLISLGFCLVSDNLLLWIYFIICFPLCYISAIIIEERFLENKFGQEFKEYKKSVPAFLPARIRMVNFRNNFSRTSVVENKEHYNWFTILILLIILYFKTS